MCAKKQLTLTSIQRGIQTTERFRVFCFLNLENIYFIYIYRVIYIYIYIYGIVK